MPDVGQRLVRMVCLPLRVRPRVCPVPVLRFEFARPTATASPSWSG